MLIYYLTKEFKAKIVDNNATQTQSLTPSERQEITTHILTNIRRLPLTRQVEVIETLYDDLLRSISGIDKERIDAVLSAPLDKVIPRLSVDDNIRIAAKILMFNISTPEQGLFEKADLKMPIFQEGLNYLMNKLTKLRHENLLFAVIEKVLSEKKILGIIPVEATLKIIQEHICAGDSSKDGEDGVPPR